MKILILCGGAGSRLWPVSRELTPKQFIPFFDKQSLFQKTIERNQSVAEEFLIISNQKMEPFIQAQMPHHLKDDHLLFLETIGRNTAAAIALSSFFCNPTDILLVTPSDHLIKDTNSYHQMIQRAETLAKKGFLVSFGIQPTRPETGLGYIAAKGDDVIAFHEKPSVETAQKYYDLGTYLWNSGMFCFQISTFLEELRTYAPMIYESSKHLASKLSSQRCRKKIIFLQDELLKIPSISIDYAVMEHSQKIKVLPCSFGWSDLGSFDALHEEFQVQESDANICINAQKLYPWKATNNFIIGSERIIALLGVQDLLIADTPDALLIAKKGTSQAVKNITTMLKEEQPTILNKHNIVQRPWGSFEVLLDAQTYKVKRIIVKPLQKLSLQKHLYRSEHWTVVQGIAWVTNGEDVFTLQTNESTYIPAETVHRLENKENYDLILIEVQLGSSTSEEDIIRLEDLYGRI